MNILADYAITVVANGYEITIPKPTAYILEKLIINENQGTKREKDLRAVQRVLDVIYQSENEVETLKTIYDGLSIKQKKKVNQVCEEFELSYLNKQRLKQNKCLVQYSYNL